MNEKAEDLSKNHQGYNNNLMESEDDSDEDFLEPEIEMKEDIKPESTADNEYKEEFSKVAYPENDFLNRESFSAGSAESGQSFTIGSNLICITCGKSFKNARSMRRHKLGHAGHFHSCLLCGKSFLSKSSLKTHELTHTGEKAFTCMTCGKNFSQSSSLKIHEVIHTGERAFKCVTCGKSFKQGSHLKAHELSHTGEKKHTCQTCGRAFGLAGQLRRHENLHLTKPHIQQRNTTGQKAFSCGKCGKTFTLDRNLKRHEKMQSCESKSIDTSVEPHNSNQDQESNTIQVADTVKTEFESPANYFTSLWYPMLSQLAQSTESSSWKSSYDASAVLLNDTNSTNREDHCDQNDSPERSSDDLQKEVEDCNVSLDNKNKDAPDLDSDEELVEVKQEVDEDREYVNDPANGTNAISKAPCPQCGNVYQSIYGLNKHIALYHTLGDFVCEQCGEHFDLKGKLKYHMFKTHSASANKECHMICQYCAKEFRSKDMYNKHIQRVHSAEENMNMLECTECGKMYSNKAYLQAHVSTVHLIDSRYCEICGRYCKNKMTLNNHMKNAHSGPVGQPAEFPCDQCGRIFSAPVLLRKHKSLNHVLGEFPCQRCGESFELKIKLKGHYRKAHKVE